jgi:hypothetical protein
LAKAVAATSRKQVFILLISVYDLLDNNKKIYQNKRNILFLSSLAAL